MLDLEIGRCRLALAAKKGSNLNLAQISHIKVATKYPEIAKKHFAKIGVQCEVIKLSGAIEIAPALGLCDAILDLVSSGKTLLENDMVELQKIFDVTSRLIVNRTSLKTSNDAVNQLIKIFDAAA
jgi:ATP phosphoribosyltransferase